jgi:hypothetical protein
MHERKTEKKEVEKKERKKEGRREGGKTTGRKEGRRERRERLPDGSRGPHASDIIPHINDHIRRVSRAIVSTEHIKFIFEPNHCAVATKSRSENGRASEIGKEHI